MAAARRRKKGLDQVIQGHRFPDGVTIEGILATPLALEASIQNRRVPKAVQAFVWLGVFISVYAFPKNKVLSCLTFFLALCVLTHYARSVTEVRLTFTSKARFMSDASTGYERLWQLASLVFAMMANRQFQNLEAGLQTNFYDNFCHQHLQAVESEYLMNALNTIHAKWRTTFPTAQDEKVVNAEIVKFSGMVRTIRGQAGFAVAATHFAAPVRDGGLAVSRSIEGCL